MYGIHYGIGFPILGETVRVDPAGDGHFGAPRGTRSHGGVDLLIDVPWGDCEVTAPCDCEVRRIGLCYSLDQYPDRAHLRLVELTWNLGFQKILYMEPCVQAGQKIGAGEQIGVALDVSRVYPGSGMLPHIHWELWIAPEFLRIGKDAAGVGVPMRVDPMAVARQWS